MPTREDERKTVLEAANKRPAASKAPKSPQWKAASEAVTSAQAKCDQASKDIARLAAEREDLWKEKPQVSLDLKRTVEIESRLRELVIEQAQANAIQKRLRIPLLEAQLALVKIEEIEAYPEVERTEVLVREAEALRNAARGLHWDKQSRAREIPRQIGEARGAVDRAEQELREAIGYESLPVVRTRQRVAR